jgi:kinesin family member C2/C3
LRRYVGVVCAKDLAEEPSEDEFLVGLRNGIILCTALNKIQPGAVPKVAFLSFRSVVFHFFYCAFAC